jgi:hypothetical protein
MPLGLQLRLSLSILRKFIGADGVVVVDGEEDLLLTQAGDAIITQNGDFLVRQEASFNLITQSGDLLLTQAGNTIETS